jgi:hypothetical protein
MPNGSVTVTYVLPLSGDGKVELHINAPLALEDKDREFILSVMELVGKFAGMASPGARRGPMSPVRDSHISTTLASRQDDPGRPAGRSRPARTDR